MNESVIASKKKLGKGSGKYCTLEVALLLQYEYVRVDARSGFLLILLLHSVSTRSVQIKQNIGFGSS